jgi:hypothetical protein
VTLVVSAGACSAGGSDGGLVTDGGASSTLAAQFVPDQPSPGDDTVAMAGAGNSGDLVTVAINVRGVDDVFGADVNVVYDDSRVVYVTWQPGALLESGGQSVQYLVTPTAGNVEIGASVIGGSGVDATTSQPLIRLTFRALEAGDSGLTFGSADLLDDHPPGPQSIPGLSWHGGSIVAN